MTSAPIHLHFTIEIKDEGLNAGVVGSLLFRGHTKVCHSELEVWEREGFVRRVKTEV